MNYYEVVYTVTETFAEVIEAETPEQAERIAEKTTPKFSEFTLVDVIKLEKHKHENRT